LYGLGDTLIKSLGFLFFYIIFGKGEKLKILSIDFIVIDVRSVYNVLIGKVIFNRFGAVVFIFHLCMKFSILSGIVTVRGD
ncbi:hypothetical protein DF186_14155, partial [Enterococcus hirae]